MKSWQKKLVIYGSSSLGGCLVMVLVSVFALHEGLFYSFCYGLLGAGCASVCARVIYHLYLKDYAPEMWQITVYMLLACAGWLGGILSTTWGWVSFWLSVMSIGILMGLGTRFVRKVAEARVQNSMETTLRFHYVDDKLGGAQNLDKPLTIVVDGKALTVAECLEKKLYAEAKRGREYIKKITEDE